MEGIYLEVDNIKGIGKQKKTVLKSLGIKTIKDLLYYFPRDYDNRSKLEKLRDKLDGEKINIVLEILGNPKSTYIKNMVITKVKATDGETECTLTWFNQKYIEFDLRSFEKIKLSGKVSISKKYNNITISNIIYTKELHSNSKIGSVVPIYSLTKGITGTDIIKALKNVFKNKYEELEILPTGILETNGLLTVNESLETIHFPKENEKEKFIKARKTLIYLELLKLHLGLRLLRKNRVLGKSFIVFDKEDRSKEFLDKLPFKLTSGQKKVIDEIYLDMESKKQMNRLIQGDVGSGKTIVAALGMVKAISSGYQTAFMAPTEILANQHYLGLKNHFEEMGYRIELLTSNIKKSKKRDIIKKLENGELDIIIGTHAIIQENIIFKNLGLVITDEQHRFGVEQRAKMTKKGLNPDIIIMSATPIPRTLSLVVYGDLDISIIDTMPKGRKAIKTYVITKKEKSSVFSFISKQIENKKQTYIVCPLIEDSETLVDLNSIDSIYKETKTNLPNYKIEIVTGKQDVEVRKEIMERFKEGEIDILIATTVIEVGVDVPNANTIIINNAERFGLSQLHQLRGRVGRGSEESYCFLINESSGEVAKERCKIISESTDGFYISEKDLELRGMGEFFGFRQHGIPEFKIAKFPRDIKKLEEIQKISMKIMDINGSINNKIYDKLIRDIEIELFID